MSFLNTLHAEQAVLGSIVHDNTALEDIVGILRKADFSLKFHQDVFLILNELISKGIQADIICVSNELKKRYEETNDESFIKLCEIANSHYCRANIKAYASIVRDGSLHRAVVTLANDLITEAKNGKENILDTACKRIMQLVDGCSLDIKSIGELLPKVLEDIEARRNRDSHVTGISTGFHVLDQLTGGLHKGDLIILAARPAMGKTILAMNIAEHAAIVGKIPVVIFSMEMSKQQLAERSLVSIAKIDANKVKTGNLDSDHISKIADSVAYLSDAKIYIDDRASMDIAEIRAVCRRIKRDHGLALIVVDYLTLMAGDGENETVRIGNISRGLKLLARDLDVPVIAVSQLNRALESRNDKRPAMADLRQSGAIEQDADLVLFIYRDEVYNKESRQRGLAEIIIGKHRHGALGVVNLAFNGNSYCFNNAEVNTHREYQQPKAPIRKQYLY